MQADGKELVDRLGTRILRDSGPGATIDAPDNKDELIESRQRDSFF
jgi:hypothetical protein